MAKILDEFKAFIVRGNVMDLAVGIILGVAFNGIVSSLVNDVIMPPIGAILGGVDFSNIYINLSGQQFESLAAAQEAGAATINIGVFINAVINFLIVSAAVFFLVRALNRFIYKPQPPAPELPKPDPQQQLVEQLTRLVNVMEAQQRNS
ncbi:MAG: large conductance mechanosensitive channel protein MscL [Synechococcaceae cyanobacterium SM2_3_2]|nr:large conductance mechanosensitive channel protein MscL [Synechococcaceae cyanobacterium SM2_3_2]